MDSEQLSNEQGNQREEMKKRRSRRQFHSKKRPVKTPQFVTIDRPNLKKGEDGDILVSFTTKQRQYAVPSSAITIPDTYNCNDLNKLVATMLTKGSTYTGTPPDFDFLVDGSLCVGKLSHKINDSETLTREGIINIEFLERMPEPEHKDALNHDDWVSSIHYNENNYLLTGCYDHTIHIWRPNALGKNKQSKLSEDKTAHRIKIPDAHKAPVKVVSWIPRSDNMFVSGGMDQSVLVWDWNSSTNSVRCVYRCRGHIQSVESLSATADGKMFATGSWDGALKIWTTNEDNVVEADGTSREPYAKKRAITQAPPKTKSPRVTLSEHSQSVSGLVWPTLCTLASCSWDNSVRLWDVDAEKKTLQYVAPCSCLSLDSSPFNNTILVTTVDNHVRLLDPRDEDVLILSKTYQSHKRWANSVKWSPSNEYHFATGGFDTTAFLWDIRGPRTPLWVLPKHTDNILTLEWSRFCPKAVFTGSADTNVHMFCL